MCSAAAGGAGIEGKVGKMTRSCLVVRLGADHGGVVAAQAFVGDVDLHAPFFAKFQHRFLQVGVGRNTACQHEFVEVVAVFGIVQTLGDGACHRLGEGCGNVFHHDLLALLTAGVEVVDDCGFQPAEREIQTFVTDGGRGDRA